MTGAPPEVWTYERARAQFTPLVHKLANRFPQSSTDDLVQVGFVALMRACDTWRDDGGATFATWAYREVWGAIRRAAREQRQRGGRARRDGDVDVSLDARLEVDDADGATLHDVVASDATSPEEHCSREQARAAIRRALASLSERHALVMQLHLDGTTDEEIAETLAVSRPRVSQLRQQVIERTRELLGVTVDAETQTAAKPRKAPARRISRAKSVRQ